MKILLVARRVPELPLRNGYDVHLYHLLVELAPMHEIHVLTPPGDAEPLDIGVEWHVATTDTSATSTRIKGLTAVTRRQAVAMAPGFQQALAELRPDVVHIVSGRLAPLGQCLQGVPSVLGALDATHLNAKAAMKNAGLAMPRRLAGYVVSRRITRTSYPDFSVVVLVSDEDAAATRSLSPSLRLVSIPNGVDADSFAFEPGTIRDPNQLLFTGALSYPPNEQAAELLANHILPGVQRSIPDAHLRLVGRDPSEAVTELTQLPGVEVVADVPEMAPYLSQAAVFVCPMTSGTGIKNKLLEALANGLACVTTPLALQGIDAESDREVLVGADTDELVAATVRLLNDAALRERLGAAGQTLVQRNHTWKMVAERYTELYEEIV